VVSPLAATVSTWGVWARGPQLSAAAAVDIEALGFGTIWIGQSPPADLALVDELLAATTTLTIATGIVNIWSADAAAVGASFRRIEERFPGRFVLGIGTGHPEATSDYAHPYEALSRYLDVLDDAGVPESSRVLAALGPRVLRLARDRSAGAHPYLVTPDHTRVARETLGADRLLAPEHKAVVETDVERARLLGRPAVEKPYLGLSNYLNNLRRLGWTDADFADGGSDALIDALVAHGSADEVAAQLRQHLDAGADHVCVQIVTQSKTDSVVPGLRALAPALFG